MRAKERRLRVVASAILVAVTMIAAACGGGSGSADSPSESAQAEASVEQPTAVEAPSEQQDPDPTAVPEPTAPPEPTATPAPTATPQPDLDGDGDPDVTDPDLDGDGVENDADDFPDDDSRSQTLTTYFGAAEAGGLQLPDTPATRAFNLLAAEWASDETTSAELPTVVSPKAIAVAGEAVLIGEIDSHRTQGFGDFEVIDVRHVSEYDLRVAVGPADKSTAFDVRIAIDPDDGLARNIRVSPLDISVASLIKSEQQDLTLDEAVAGYTTLASTTSVLVAEVIGTECQALSSHEEATPVGVSTMATGWFLTAAADAIAAGTLRADQSVTLAPSSLGGVGSVSSGVFTQPADLTFQQAVNLMVQRGDAGAADLVFDIVGRQAIDDTVTAAASSPSELIPMLSASQVSHLDGTVDAGMLQAFVDGDDAMQLALIDETLQPLGAYASADQSSATISPAASWQSTALDVCVNLAGLRSYADFTDSATFVDEALSRSTGYPGIAAEWDRVWHMAGGHPDLNYGQVPGVSTHSLAWLLENEGGPVYVVVAISNEPDLAPISPWIFDVYSHLGRIHQILIDG